MDCNAETTVPLRVRYSWRNGEAAVALERPETRLDYRCEPVAPRELAATIPASQIELVLRDESLVVVHPATDRRRLRPED
jgi:hypothetical protein